jgi:hypothetical protein
MPYTLVVLRDRVEALLSDATHARYDLTLLDEAIRQALDAYAERLPARRIATLEVTQAGGEVDTSSLPYGTIERVWWDYDADAPTYPPKWRNFELWPGEILYILDEEKPQVGDVVRIWYTIPHTLAGLDLATETTFPEAHASLIAVGAAAFAALSRRAQLIEMINDNPWAPRNLERWAEARLRAYLQRLDELARHDAAIASGLAPGPPLDRWDAVNTW